MASFGGGGAGAGGFNKMLVMLPVMLAARKLDGENVNTVQMVRIAYGVVQLICILLVLYVYTVATKVSTQRSVYVPPALSPFANPNGPKKYTQISYAAHVHSAARSLVGSTLFGVAMTCGLHYYKGMLMGLAIQVVMAPLNLWENPLIKSFLQGIALTPENSVFDEKLSVAELGDNAEVVDEQGRVIVAVAGPAIAAAAAASSSALLEPPKTTTTTKEGLTTLILDTWDAGAKADVAKLLSCLTKDNINTATEPDRWTALMILSGLKHTPETVLRQCIELGAKLAQADVDGWTCLHWAAFHGNETAAAVLLAEQPSLATRLDLKKLTPLEVAAAEKSEGVVKVIQTSTTTNLTTTSKSKTQ